MENFADSIYFKDRQCRLVRASRRMAIDLGFNDPSEMIGKTDQDLYGEEFGQRTLIDDLQVMETGRPIIGLVESRTLPEGNLFWTSTTKLPVYDDHGNIIGLLGITREINKLKHAEMELQHLATHDILTSLPNRYLFFDRLEQVLLRARRLRTSFAVLYLDLNRFKVINDQYGHDTGDKVLKQVAAGIKNTLRESDTVARMGSDEFVIILETIKKSRDAVRIASKIGATIQKETHIEGRARDVSVSIGISIYPEHGTDTTTLLKAADHAMYKAKRNEKLCELFEVPKHINP
ncbi:MAG: GGDEF domain-containing protein [Anaerolineales bacterium]|nr:GGDEF domain-containing protein [Anaerolineales bacterium]